VRDRPGVQAARATRPRSRRVRWLRAIPLVLAAAILVSVVLFPTLRDDLVGFLDWAGERGPLGVAIVGLAHVPAAVLLVPIPFFNIGAGAVGGLVGGVPAAVLGTTLGAASSFLISRRLARDRIQRRMGFDSRLRALDRAIGEDGLKLVFLLRLSPVFPYGILNYTLGLTRISFRRYLLATLLGLLPKTILYVSLGAGLRRVSDLASGDIELGTAQVVLMSIGLASTAVAGIVVTRIAGRALRRSPAFE
jgi:uncharacterized membrane protein YdjX (TVP38/TMEM64 family)